MPKDPEDHPGDSHPNGDTPEENSPRPDGSPDTPDSSEDQGELPFGGESNDDASHSDLGKTPEEDSGDTETPSESAEPEDNGESEAEEEPRDDQAQDSTSKEEPPETDSGEDPHIAGELEPDHDDPYHDEYHHDHDEYHHDYHHEYDEEHEHQYDHDYHGHEDDHGDYGYGHGAGYSDSDDDSGEDDEEEGFGGPIKPFLDHLEDLRWTIMKVVVAVVVGMLMALIGSPYIVKFLTYPLNSAQQIQQVNSNPDKRMIPIKLGDGVVSHIRESDLKDWAQTGRLRQDGNNTAEITAIRLMPSRVLDRNGTQYSLQMHLDTNGSDRVPWEVELKAYGPLKSFFIALKIGLYGGLTISMPFVIYFLAQFILPALRINEKQWLYKLSGFGAGLFMLGVVFCYLIIMKVALWASVGFANMLGFGADEWQAEEYISFVCKFMVGMGLAFQMPMILLFLVKVGILDYKKLSDFRMYAVVANLIIAAVITPTGDPFTLSLVAVPLQLLYELSTLIAWFWHKRELAEEEDEE